MSRRERKRALTAGSSSRWAGAITRASEDQWQLATRNLRAEGASLRARVRRIEARAAVPAGQKNGRVPGYSTPAERHAKTVRLQALRGRLSAVERRLEAGRVSVTRGGRDLLRKRGNLAAAGLTGDQWRQRWEAARLFLTADGEAGKAWGNETIRFHPRLRHQLRPCIGALVPRRVMEDRPRPVPPLAELRAHPMVAADLNAGHLAVAVVASDGNVLGVPVRRRR